MTRHTVLFITIQMEEIQASMRACYRDGSVFTDIEEFLISAQFVQWSSCFCCC